MDTNTLRDRMNVNLGYRTPRKLIFLSGFIVWVFIAAVLIGIVAYQISIASPRFTYRLAAVPMLLVLLLVTSIALRVDPNHMPIIILIAAAFVPITLPTGTQSRIVDSLLLSVIFVGVWMFRQLTLEKRIKLIPSPVNKPIVLFSIITIVSLIWSNFFRDHSVTFWKTFPLVQIAAAVVLIMLPMTLLMVANLVERVKTLKLMASIMLIAGVVGIVQRVSLSWLPVNTYGLFAMWVIAISIGLAIFHRGLSLLLRILLIGLAMSWVFLGLVRSSAWLAGWVPGLVAIGVLCFLRSKYLFILLVILLTVLFVVNSALVEEAIELETQTSLETRIAAWKKNWTITKEHLLFGTGPAGYAAYYMSYFPGQATATHSNYIDILAQIGVIGFVTVIWMIGAIFYVSLKMYRKIRGRGDFIEGLGNAVIAGFIGSTFMMGFGDWLFPFAYTQTIAGYDHAIYSWLFIGCIFVINRLIPSRESRTGIHL